MQFRYQIGNSIRTVNIERSGEEYQVLVDGKYYSVTVQKVSEETITFIANQKPLQAYRATQGEQHYIAFDAAIYTLNKIDSNQRRRVTMSSENSLTAAMPGQVVNILAEEGDEVKRGQTLIILEAMKMEIRVTAPADGKVSKLLVQSGQIVERGQRLIDLASS